MVKNEPILPALTVRRCHYIAAQRVRDGRDGCLNIITTGREVGFVCRRVYYIHGFEGRNGVRGRHAHRNTRTGVVLPQWGGHIGS